MHGNSYRSDRKDVSAEAAEGRSIGIDGMILWKVVGSALTV